MSIEYGLVLTYFSAQFDIPYSIFFLQVTLSLFSKFKMIVGISLGYLVFADKFFVPKKKIFNSKVAWHILCSSFVCKLLHECKDIKKKKMLGVHR